MHEHHDNFLPVFVDVILPLAVRKPYTYSVPAEWISAVEVGKRVEVEFGKSRHYAGIVVALHDTEPAAYTPKPVLAVLDETPILNPVNLELWQWVADYYCCSLGEVMIAALPSLFRLSSESQIILSPFFDKDDESLSRNERLITDALLIQESITVQSAQAILNIKSIMPTLKRMTDKRLIYWREEIREKYKPRTVSYVRLAFEPAESGALEVAFSKIKGNAERQMETLLAIIQLSRIEPDITVKAVYEKAASNAAVLKSLADKGLVELFTKEVSRLRDYGEGDVNKLSLSAEQEQAVQSIKQSFAEGKPAVLLQGVTGSGKTEVYIRLIREALDAGRQVAYLLPEIALTSQLVSRLKQHFGSEIVVYHSKFSDQERIEAWQSVINGSRRLIIGARSAVFMPYTDLGLIIVDEEHDPSYKQQTPAPRYNARDVAIWLGQQIKSPVLLGSATPSLETWYNAQHAKFGHAQLTRRYGGTLLPDITLVNAREEALSRRLKGRFTSVLLNAIKDALERKEQVILFQNRRGYATVVRCNVCEWTQQCKSCDVSMTYHKYSNDLRCHYCGYTIAVPLSCPACGARDVKPLGFGTEKIEDDIKVFFPEARVARMDLDTVKGKHDHEKLIDKFEQHEIDILVGTQMVSKGLDFDKVSLVGVLSADQLMSFPDFRTDERAFQLLTQVAGRAGRRGKQGQVIIQTFNPDKPLIEDVLAGEQERFITRELERRAELIYPPYCRLIGIQLKHKDKRILDEAAIFFARELKTVLQDRVLGPAQPMVSRVRDYYLLDFLIKLERRQRLIDDAKQWIDQTTVALQSQKMFSGVRVNIDVDLY